ncbi:MAG TPA: 4-alpha-glucanotransferase, partial [Acidimicrobiales bacterium]|nr:4-alpha-glucanotransferase [Acidimicrobiales bacterium]
ALESVRARAWVVGEDLGTVPPLVREEMARRDVLSTRVMWFEPVPPERWPECSLAAVTTHDLPTVAGIWTGADERDQVAYDVQPDARAAAAMKHRLADWMGIPSDAPVEEAVVAAHRLLARAPSDVALAGLDDALAVTVRPNLPGTSERPNWCLPLPRPLDTLEQDALLVRVADEMNAGRAGDRSRAG